jgi:hypothetical protein
MLPLSCPCLRLLSRGCLSSRSRLSLRSRLQSASASASRRTSLSLCPSCSLVGCCICLSLCHHLSSHSSHPLPLVLLLPLAVRPEYLSSSGWLSHRHLSYHHRLLPHPSCTLVDCQADISRSKPPSSAALVFSCRHLQLTQSAFSSPLLSVSDRCVFPLDRRQRRPVSARRLGREFRHST